MFGDENKCYLDILLHKIKKLRHVINGYYNYCVVLPASNRGESEHTHSELSAVTAS